MPKHAASVSFRISLNPDPDRAIVIGAVHTLGGCGGTLLTRLLAALKAPIVLSECNPSSALLFDKRLNPYTQVKEWHPQIFAELGPSYRATDLAEPALFRHFIEDLTAIARRLGRRVIVRDYNYADYCGVPFMKPFYRSSLLLSIGTAMDVRSVVLVRHPLRQYASLRSHQILEHVLTPGIFLEGYLAFWDDFALQPKIKYEDLAGKPHETLKRFCAALELAYDSSAIEAFARETSVTGNLSRADENIISPSERAMPEDEMTRELQRDKRYKALLERLEYVS